MSQPRTPTFVAPLPQGDALAPRLDAPLVDLDAGDDDKAAMIASLLRQGGYRVRRRDTAVVGDETEADKPVVAVLALPIPALCKDIGELCGSLRERLPKGIPALLVGDRGDLQVRLAAVRAGASRYLSLPLDADRLYAMLDELVSARCNLERFRVLLVDDDLSMLYVHAAMLEAAGMLVHTLQEPMRLLEEVDRVDPEVLVLDVNMPGASGPELAAVLRERESKRHLPILFLSGDTDAWRQPLALSLGSDDFLNKPVSHERLAAAVVARARRSRQIRSTHRRLQGLVYEREREHLAIDQHAIVSIADPRGKIIYANDRFWVYSVEKLG